MCGCCRYRSAGVLLGKIRPKIKWADVEAVKAELQAQLDAILGGMTAADLQPPDKKKKKRPPAKVLWYSGHYEGLLGLHCQRHCLPE